MATSTTDEVEEEQHGRKKGRVVEVEEISSTSLVTVLSSAHGRQRRRERDIAKSELRAAVKYGVREAQTNPRTGERRWKYTYAGVVYITDSESRREITSWPEPCFGFDVPLVRITDDMTAQHDASVAALRNLGAWTSHTVIVVDESGSMRSTDVEDGATRSDAVWLTLALTWVGDELKAGTRQSTDVISIVSMRDSATLLVDKQPVDWVLYNTLVGFLRSSKPAEGGNYEKAIELSEQCLMHNTKGACALALLFLSDGKPSDKFVCPAPDGKRSASLTRAERDLRRIRGEIYSLGDAAVARDKKLSSRIGKLASRFGRRLTFGTIGFANSSEEFATLQSLTRECVTYGCQASFHKPALTARSLQRVLTSLSSTLTSTKTEMTSMDGSRQRTVREVMREKRSGVIEDTCFNDKRWWIFAKSLQSFVMSRVVWTQHHGRNHDKCWNHVSKFMHEDAVGVVMRKEIFDEGAERMVRKFREVNRKGEFVGPWMVAKESRFIEDYANNEDLRAFHTTFCKTQLRAERVAKTFNRKLLTIPGVDMSNTPQIRFLECAVYMLYDESLGKNGVLVERMLDTERYMKWNSNNGYVDGMHAKNSDVYIADAGKDVQEPPALGAIVEDEEEEEMKHVNSDDDDDDDDTDNDDTDDDFDDDEPAEPTNASVGTVDCVSVSFTTADIPQAFSCFSYRCFSRRGFLVCDLQGVLDETSSPPCFELTDPVIHYRSKSGRRNVYGRTDRGQKGIDSFFSTHVCSDLCRALRKTWIDLDESSRISRLPQPAIWRNRFTN